MPLALIWRAGRGSGGRAKEAFAELCAYLDHCNAEDRDAKRPPMTEVLGYRSRRGTGVGWRERARRG
jgi:cytochrome P450